MKYLLIIIMLSPYGEDTARVKEHFSMYACQAEATALTNKYPGKITTQCFKESPFDYTTN